MYYMVIVIKIIGYTFRFGKKWQEIQKLRYQLLFIIRVVYSCPLAHISTIRHGYIYHIFLS